MASRFWEPPSRDSKKPRDRLLAENKLNGLEHPQPHVLSSPPGTRAPIHLINYTPKTGEVHAPGVPAPEDELNYSLLPHDSGIGAGQEALDMPPGGYDPSAQNPYASWGGSDLLYRGGQPEYQTLPWDNSMGPPQMTPLGTMDPYLQGAPPIQEQMAGMVEPTWVQPGAGADVPTGMGMMPGQSSISGRYGTNANQRASTFQPGSPPLSPHPYGTGPGPRLQASGPAQRPFEERGTQIGNASTFGQNQGGYGGGNERMGAGQSRPRQDLPQYTGLDDDPPASTPAPEPTPVPQQQPQPQQQMPPEVAANMMPGYRPQILKQLNPTTGQMEPSQVVMVPDPPVPGKKPILLGYFMLGADPVPGTSYPPFQVIPPDVRKEIEGGGTDPTRTQITDRLAPDGTTHSVLIDMDSGDQIRDLGVKPLPPKAPKEEKTPPMEIPGDLKIIGSGPTQIAVRVSADGTSVTEDTEWTAKIRKRYDEEQQAARTSAAEIEKSRGETTKATASIYTTTTDASGQTHILNTNTGTSTPIGAADLSKGTMTVGNDVVRLAKGADGKLTAEPVYTAPRDMKVDTINGKTVQYDPRDPQNTWKEITEDEFYKPTQEQTLAKGKADIEKTYADIATGKISNVEAKAKLLDQVYKLEHPEPTVYGTGDFYLPAGGNLDVHYEKGVKRFGGKPMPKSRRSMIDRINAELGKLDQPAGAPTAPAASTGATEAKPAASTGAAAAKPAETAPAPATEKWPPDQPWQPRADQISGATPMGNALAPAPGLTGTVNPGDPNYLGSRAAPEYGDVAEAIAGLARELSPEEGWEISEEEEEGAGNAGWNPTGIGSGQDVNDPQDSPSSWDAENEWDSWSEDKRREWLEWDQGSGWDRWSEEKRRLWEREHPRLGEHEFNDPDALWEQTHNVSDALERDPPGWDKPGDPDDFLTDEQMAMLQREALPENPDKPDLGDYRDITNRESGGAPRGPASGEPQDRDDKPYPQLPWDEPPTGPNWWEDIVKEPGADRRNAGEVGELPLPKGHAPGPDVPTGGEGQPDWLKLIMQGRPDIKLPGWVPRIPGGPAINVPGMPGLPKGPTTARLGNRRVGAGQAQPQPPQPGMPPQPGPTTGTGIQSVLADLKGLDARLQQQAQEAQQQQGQPGAGQDEGGMPGIPPDIGMLGGAPGGAPPPPPGGMPGGPPTGPPGAPPGGPPGWAPPVPPGEVAGIGHRFGQEMNQGEPIHSGVDLQAQEGAETISPEDGIVEDVRDDPQGLGLTVIVRDKMGNQHKLGHLKDTRAYRGMVVAKGQNLARVGSTGNTTGSHLHWAVKDQQGQPQDPTPALGAMGGLPPVPGTEMMGPPGGTGSPPGAAAGAPSGPPMPGPGAQGPGQGALPEGIPPDISALQGMGNDRMGAGQEDDGGDDAGDLGITPSQQAEIDATNRATEQRAEQARMENERRKEEEANRHAEAVAKLEQDWKIHQDDVRLQQEKQAEDARHNAATEAIERERIAADLEIQKMRDANAIKLQQMQNGNAIYIQQGDQAFKDWQQQQKLKMDMLGSALKNPWMQRLSGMTPGANYQGQQVGGQNISSLISQILQPYDPKAWGAQNAPISAGLDNPNATPGGGPEGPPQTPGGGMFQQNPQYWNQGGQPQQGAWGQPAPTASEQFGWTPSSGQMKQPQQAAQPVPPAELEQQGMGNERYGAGQAAQPLPQTSPGQMPLYQQPSWQQWRGWDPFQRAAYRTDIEAIGPGAWEEAGQSMADRFSGEGGNEKVTKMQAAGSGEPGRAGMEMTADVFGKAPQQFWQEQNREWSQAQAPRVKQNLTGPSQPRY